MKNKNDWKSLSSFFRLIIVFMNYDYNYKYTNVLVCIMEYKKEHHIMTLLYDTIGTSHTACTLYQQVFSFVRF
jgi:hypothetical protein